ncbi:hypothetical protein ABB37_09308 [Leptomonas pyrrhocoris]|uniref:Uncharacterized protein n=1 Tax=Leptomonas pyrrhocoris TaxID=157538 RepID=A0A0N0DR79_LEPPY|nr:hypothetical protein ABB37_09308 [Leptomonas pyrrhocoris]XP_015652758.1 hypothetical protein ABB37_09308 [Leptomonas pyrrhocoris]KPA74318.1 hypothetical protein ABB37_09308 [Leptomonas pyrrhocoris]KPA74319.1 hypothetical protein ABB37_09308 [Leptomonas pyrrhocoris]|eukprot:XP_015652757.1 hypothetical protein ABB37_09308 [Leptomonas pyrrhocoris]
MKPVTVGFRLPSLREACAKNDATRSSDAAAAAQTLAIPYAVGKATLQLTGIHVRLQPTKTRSSPKALKSQKENSSSAAAAISSPAVVGAIAADIVVHAHVRGELNTAPRTYVIAVLPVRYDASHNADGTTPGKAPSYKGKESKASGAATSASSSAAPYDKRVLNAQAREARRGVVAPAFPSSFAKVDLRTQMERVRLSFTVVPVGTLSTGGAAAHRGKRGRAGDEDAAAAEAEKPQPSLVDCLVDVTVVGTASPIA